MITAAPAPTASASTPFASVADAVAAPLPTDPGSGMPGMLVATFPAYFMGNTHGGVLADEQDLAFAKCACPPRLAPDAPSLAAEFYADALSGVEHLHESSQPWKPDWTGAPLYGAMQVTGRIYDDGTGTKRIAVQSAVVSPQH